MGWPASFPGQQLVFRSFLSSSVFLGYLLFCVILCTDWVLYSVLWPDFCMNFLCLVCCMPNLLCPPWFDHLDRRFRCSWMWHFCWASSFIFWRWSSRWRVRITNLILQFSASCCYFTQRSNYFAQHPVLKHLKLCSSCTVNTKFHAHTKLQIKL